MRVLILNSCSTLNRGDAAIVLGQIRLLQKYCPEAQIAITSKTPSLDYAFYDPIGVEVLAPLTPALSTYKGSRRPLVESARALGNWRNKRSLIQVMQHSDLVLSCGGGYLYSYRNRLPGTTFWQNVIHAYLATFLGKPLVFLPQSFGPFSNSLAQRGVKRLLERPNVLKIYAREAVSYQLLHDILDEVFHSRIALCPDMALYLTENSKSDVTKYQSLGSSQPILVINLREWTFPETGNASAQRLKREAYLNALNAVGQHFILRYQGVVVVVPHTMGPDPSEDDRGICQEFYRRIRRCCPTEEDVQYREFDTRSSTEFMELLSQAALLIGTRLHSCILAMLVGVPVVSIGYQYKSQGIMEMLRLNRFNANIDDLSPDWLLAAVDEIMSHRPEIQEEIRQSLGRACAQIDDQVGTLLKSIQIDVEPQANQDHHSLDSLK